MATTATPRRPPPNSRPVRSPSVSTTPALSGVLAKGATARSALNPRTSSLKSPTRTSFSRGGTPPLGGNDMSESLMRETEEKEQLLVQLQNKEQAVSELTAENDHLSSALNAAEGRLAELYTDQARQEEEMATRLEVMEKLRIQARELERDKRELQRRYNEQTSTFEAERQAFYDNEQHLKSRIQSLSQSLTQARKQAQTATSQAALTEAESETEVEEEVAIDTKKPEDKSQDLNDPEAEPAEITSLKLELSTLSTSYASLQGTLGLLQSQLVDLKRVNRVLQEENESYMILLREKTLNGQFDVMRTVGTESSSDGDEADDDDDEDEERTSADHSSLRSTGRHPLEPVEEHEYEHEYERDLAQELERAESDEELPTKKSTRHRKKGSISDPDNHQGESLAGLGVTGPGLDLAAELGRAENKDILDGSSAPATDNSSPRKKGRKSGVRSVSVSSAGVLEVKSTANDIDALRTEVKSLKDANKALSLYASRIIDRIIAQEGFEHVLAVDYADKTPTSPTPGASGFSHTALPKSPTVPEKKPRPQSMFFGRQASNPSPQPTSEESTSRGTSPPLEKPAITAARQNRRSLSFDWRSFSVFGGGEKKSEPHNPNLRPLKLGSGPTVTGARKLDTQEDEEDRRERERLDATMKLMGISKPPSSPPPMIKSVSSPMETGRPSSDEGRPSLASNSSSPAPSRWSFFRSRSGTQSETSSLHSAPSGATSPRPGNLTQEALEQAEAQEKLAALDAHEKTLSAELAKGGSGGFTEIAPRRSRGGRRSAGGSGSGSTVWSAGMSRDGHHDDD
ncbi:hypothetical protein PUNSTDRAFT_80329 [Punctularia strigosozonata HHB-11173 SS5]|uniref:uncharacterized protein n=1 Tax=Punctularia strigosozonata (strain HHB-11173) TaxID=741275 RepID=UPI0004417D88|nr:uncharacterized protein PUNSTDRAFT_80329 [Punctularia strigosozonata HHB-11173 SS5]EIN14183.1 hypothetical protein PUNSTDRAFT_80329 [Punctularia strigosozonata HHB-11173 SS5]